MSKNILIFCEGKERSWDELVLNKFAESLPLNLSVIPAGGVRGLKAYMIGYLNNKSRVLDSNHALCFRDRDFDFPIEPNSNKKDKGKTWVTDRVTIENYLLSAELLYAFFSEKKSFDVSQDNVNALLIQSAISLKSYQAARHALGKIRSPFSLKTTWTNGSGNIPNDLTLERCKIEATNLIQTYQDESNKTNTDLFEQILDEFLNKFQPSFFENQHFLTWFNGKDLMKKFQIDTPQLPFSTQSYYRFALNRFDYTQFSDFIALKKYLEVEI